MAEQAIETAAINWTPVNPMGSELGARQKEGVLGKPELGLSSACLAVVLSLPIATDVHRSRSGVLPVPGSLKVV